MDFPRVVVGALGAAVGAWTFACGGGSTSKSGAARTQTSAERPEQVHVVVPSYHAAPAGAAKGEVASDEPMSAPASASAPEKSGLATLGQLATAQALIVSLIVAPFSSGVNAEPEHARVSRVPR